MAANADINSISKALNVSARRVNQLVHEGMPRDERGKYDLGACMLWYIRYLQKALSKKSMMDGDGNITSLQGNRDELLRIQIERERFELAKAKSEFLPIEAHERILSDLIQETKARVRAVGSRIAQDLVGETSRLMIQAKLERAHDEALVQLSKVVPRIPSEATEKKSVEPEALEPRVDRVEGEKPKKVVIQKPKPKKKAAKKAR